MASIGELTRSSSDSSDLTSDDSDHKANEEHCKCAAQADEMHDQYLNRLEASFVTQLHRSTSWLDRWQNRSMNRNISVNQGKKASEQVSIRDGYWENINFRRATTADSLDVLKSPWVKRFKHGDKTCSTGPPVANECRKNHNEENFLRDPRTLSRKVGRYSAGMLINETCFSTVGSTSEGSGQNFVYEDCDDDSTFRVKKLKFSVADTSSADQIVPSSENDANIQPIIGKIPPENQPHQSLTEEYRNIPKPVLQSLQRGR